MIAYKTTAIALFIFIFTSMPLAAQESESDWIYDWSQEKFYGYKRKLSDGKRYIQQQRRAAKNAELYHEQSAYLFNETELPEFNVAEKRYAQSEKLNDEARVLFEKSIREFKRARSAASQANELEFESFADLSDRLLSRALKLNERGLHIRKQENDPYNIGHRYFNTATDEYQLIYDEMVKEEEEEGPFLVKKHRKFTWE